MSRVDAAGMKYLCEVSDLAENRSVTLSAGSRNFIAIRMGDEISVLSHTCPHDGADLSDARVCGGELICPLHHASFEISNGRVTGPPSRDNLTSYESRVEDGKLYVGKPRDVPIPEVDVTETNRVVIVGGGPAGLSCAEELRRCGYPGGITLITADRYAPYDRTLLSKEFIAAPGAPEPSILRDPMYLKMIGIELMTDTRVTKIVREDRKLLIEDGTKIDYDTLVVATGSLSRGIDGANLDEPGIHSIRSYEDARRFSESLERASHLTILGAGFIGLEVAGALRDSGAAITIVAEESLPLEQALGSNIGAALFEHHTSQGVEFFLNSRVDGIDTAKRRLLLGDRSLEYELLLVAVGAVPDTRLLASAGLCGEGEAAEVGPDLRTSDTTVFAVGDVAGVRLPNGVSRFEHWTWAERRGIGAARIIAGVPAATDEIPFFWSQQGEILVRSVGTINLGLNEVLLDAGGSRVGEAHEQIDRHGTNDLLVGFFLEGLLEGAVAIGHDAALLSVECRLRNGEPIDFDAFQSLPRS